MVDRTQASSLDRLGTDMSTAPAWVAAAAAEQRRMLRAWAPVLHPTQAQGGSVSPSYSLSSGPFGTETESQPDQVIGHDKAGKHQRLGDGTALPRNSTKEVATLSLVQHSGEAREENNLLMINNARLLTTSPCPDVYVGSGDASRDTSAEGVCSRCRKNSRWANILQGSRVVAETAARYQPYCCITTSKSFEYGSRSNLELKLP